MLPSRFYTPAQHPTGDFLWANWAPQIDLDEPHVNPLVGDCLSDFISDFIYYWTTRSTVGIENVTNSATSVIMHSFSFNAEMEYPLEPYRNQMMVREHVSHISILTDNLRSALSEYGCIVAALLLLHDELAGPIRAPLSSLAGTVTNPGWNVATILPCGLLSPLNHILATLYRILRDLRRRGSQDGQVGYRCRLTSFRLPTGSFPPYQSATPRLDQASQLRLHQGQQPLQKPARRNAVRILLVILLCIE
jgi:hypothetical protein